MFQASHIARAEALIEALPFMQKYRGQLFVIKYGGSAMEDEHAVDRLLRDVVFLEAVGINPVLIHGGGKAITRAMDKAAYLAMWESMSEAVHDVVASLGGSISAEHGIGLVKKPYLRYSRSPEEIAMLRAIKRALDPKGILNPGKIFD